MIDNSIIKHNNSVLRWIAKEINEGSYNEKWVKLRIDEKGKISSLKREEDIKCDRLIKNKKKY